MTKQQPDIYTATPIPINESAKYFTKHTIFYELWWFIRGNNTIRKSQIRRVWFFIKNLFKRRKTHDSTNSYKDNILL